MRSAPRAVKPEFRRDLRLHRGRAQNMDAPRRRTRVNPTAHATVAAPFPRVGPPRADQVPAALHAPRPPRSSFAGSTRSRRSAYRSQRRKGPASQSRKTVTDTFAGAGTSRGRNRHARAHGRVGRSAATSRHRHRTRPSRCLFTPGNRRRAGRSGSAAPEVFPTSTSSRPPAPRPQAASTGRRSASRARRSAFVFHPSRSRNASRQSTSPTITSGPARPSRPRRPRAGHPRAAARARRADRARPPAAPPCAPPPPTPRGPPSIAPPASAPPTTTPASARPVSRHVSAHTDAPPPAPRSGVTPASRVGRPRRFHHRHRRRPPAYKNRNPATRASAGSGEKKGPPASAGADESTGWLTSRRRSSRSWPWRGKRRSCGRRPT